MNRAMEWPQTKLCCTATIVCHFKVSLAYNLVIGFLWETLMYKETLIVSLSVFVTFQVKFQVYTPQKNWSLSSPPWKMLLPRMDSLDRSTTTSPTVSTVYLSTTWTFCASFIIFVCSHLCGIFVLVLSGKVSYMCNFCCIWLSSSASLLCIVVCTTEIVQCHWG